MPREVISESISFVLYLVKFTKHLFYKALFFVGQNPLGIQDKLFQMFAITNKLKQ